MSGIKTRLQHFIKESGKIISGVTEGEKVVLSNCFSPLIFLTADFSSAGKIKRGLETLGRRVEIISSTRENKVIDDENLMPYVTSLNKFLLGECDCLIFLPCSAMVKFNLDKFRHFVTLKKSEIYNIDALVSKLVSVGFDRTNLVSGEGQFALRGDILDIFPAGKDKPVRLEFFDEQIEKISIFEPSTMKNLCEIKEINLLPALLEKGEDCIFDLIGKKIIDEPKRVEDETNLLLKSYAVMSDYKTNEYQHFEALYEKCDIVFDNHGLQTFSNQKAAARSYLTDFMALKYDIENYLHMNQGVILFGGSEKNKIKLQDFLHDNGMFFHDFESDVFLPKNIYVSSSAMPYSFSFLEEGIVAIGCDSLYKQNLSAFSKGKHSVFYLPKLGDYVVHAFHGIGKCIKIERMQIGDYEKDYFVIEYKNGGVLYLPSEEANTISAYVGGEGEPKLSSLGGAEFGRLKSRVKESLKEMAFSLTEVYKERQKAEGFKFKRDEFLEAKFSDAFEFPLTIDQAKAINDINHDMESHKIMDRLICGDVGFGKTEVALRACFKCAYNSRQVCLLCPTTILSEQHYRTAKSRLEAFGVKIEVLNRFKTASQAKSILEKLKNGEIDMLIGTHRLLGKDVIFKDLGLLVLDEEQRFGVEHKEQIKNARRDIDCLSLSATPIPRTLNMSLSGIRDISIIETPPKDRLPIQTYVVEENDVLIRDVLSRELARGGQAFVIYNKVESIVEFSSYIRSLLPGAQVGIAHGQMQEKQLESVISKLYDGEYNIFISTTLIENGIDLPSANTMVVIDADKLGLGQLYQIRGRIGRSDKLSYAYLTYNPKKILSVDAYKRLSAIKEFSELGSGFKIAMRDLEIRGAGNIFGKAQHGHIAKVGYDMFVKLLEEAVSELQGHNAKEESEIKMEVSLDAFISESYISQSDERIALYSKISELASESEVKSLIASLNDGYGFVPKEFENLCNVALLKNLAKGFGIEKIRINVSDCKIILSKNDKIMDERLAKVLGQFNGKLTFTSFPTLVFDLAAKVSEKLAQMIKLFIAARS